MLSAMALDLPTWLGSGTPVRNRHVLCVLLALKFHAPVIMHPLARCLLAPEHVHNVRIPHSERTSLWRTPTRSLVPHRVPRRRIVICWRIGQSHLFRLIFEKLPPCQNFQAWTLSCRWKRLMDVSQREKRYDRLKLIWSKLIWCRILVILPIKRLTIACNHSFTRYYKVVQMWQYAIYRCYFYTKIFLHRIPARILLFERETGINYGPIENFGTNSSFEVIFQNEDALAF